MMTALPTAKTGAAIRKQVPVVVDNIVLLLNHNTLGKNPIMAIPHVHWLPITVKWFWQNLIIIVILHQIQN